MTNPLNVAIIWHMHQPYYKNLLTGHYLLPWVRLHAVKDYYEMVRLAEKHESLRLTFNYVPSLLDQLSDYGHHNATDRHLDLTMIPAHQLNNDDKIEILESFFSVNWTYMLAPNRRYQQLLSKRGFEYHGREELANRLHHFSPQDFLDLQVWSNLVWFGVISKREDPLIKKLFAKGVSFTEEEKKKLIEKQREIIRAVIPLHKKLQDEGRIEVTITPMYHPILPLLCDTDSAKMALPAISLPQERFVHPEDAIAQINRAVESYRNYFGCEPRGMWPSEGSVSEEAVSHIMNAGFKWIGTDEEILVNSLHMYANNLPKGDNYQQTPLLYQPYSFARGDQNINIFFRDHSLSDLVGFVYSRWQAGDAVANFCDILHHKRRDVLHSDQQFVTSIILDGENAWEYYHNNGYDFLNSLYGALCDDPELHTVTPSQYLESDAPLVGRLERLYSGSWINHNFRIWIGHQEDNLSWDYLYQTREFLVEHEHDEQVTPEMRTKAWESLYIAQGSDWNWWYGDDHFSGNDEAFDLLYRAHLKNVYRALDISPPEHLDFPIIQPQTSKPTLSPTGFIFPSIDGMITNYYEWIEGGVFECDKMQGAMHQAESLLKKFFYGFDNFNLYLRLDTTTRLTLDWLKDKTLHFTFFAPKKVVVVLSFGEDTPAQPFIKPQTTVEYEETDEGKVGAKHNVEVAILDILEIRIPLITLGAKANERIEFAFEIKRNSHQLVRWPVSNYISFDIPSSDFEAELWFV